MNDQQLLILQNLTAYFCGHYGMQPFAKHRNACWRLNDLKITFLLFSFFAFDSIYDKRMHTGARMDYFR